jgi:adenylyl-sulfate kinase
MILWFTGLSGSGKTTLAKGLKEKLPQSIILDGDEMRNGVCKGLTYTQADRLENLRRIAEIAVVLERQGCLVIVSCITPTEESRSLVKTICGDGFRLIFLSADLNICRERDSKGLYALAKSGAINNFTGVSSSFEIPASPDLIISPNSSIEESVNTLYEFTASS